MMIAKLQFRIRSLEPINREAGLQWIGHSEGERRIGAEVP